ncbi:hypothetical protein KAU19_06270 [Candidatus Parcubacteria bacterium]|nr:hypothetical protein [Candidatus Parcubacteria bacterium]
MLKQKFLFLQNNWLLFCGLILAVLIFSLFIFNIIQTRNVKAGTTSETLVEVGNAAPTISVSLNGGNDININEGTYKWASSTITVTDNNGCDTIASVVAKLYIASSTTAGTTCSQNDLSCYIGVGSSTAANTCVATTTGNQCEAGVGDTSVEYDCGFKIWYIAHPTNDGASWASSIWSVSATTTDGAATVTATNTDQTVEIVAQNALDVTGTIDHTSVSAGNNTGGTNQTTVVTTTGNTAIDVTIEGTTMTGAGTIDEWQQKYDTDSVTYASLSYYLTSTTTPQLEIDNVKPTSTTSPSTDNVYWGLNVPGGTPNGSYSGTNTFGAASD